jgi:tetratricopeptide (TPR) repeat protein
MQTPDNSRLSIFRNKCATPGCNNLAYPGRRYCTDSCRQGRDSKARQALSRLRRRAEFTMSPLERTSLAAALEAGAISRSQRKYDICQELDNLDELLQRRGPADLDIRADVRFRAHVIRSRFLYEKPQDRDEVRQYRRALEILRDVGTESWSRIAEIRGYAEEVVRLYLNSGDFLGLAKALIACGNVRRLQGQDRIASSMATFAYHLIAEKCYVSKASEPDVKILLHNAAFWNLRLAPYRWSDRERIQKKHLIVDLATEVGTPSIWLETHRELTAYWSFVGDREKALEEFAALERLRETAAFPQYGGPCLIRPKIHVLLESGEKADRDEGIHLIESEYLRLYNDDPHYYYYHQLKAWKKQFRLSIELREPTYGSAVLTYLPRNLGSQN